MKETFLKYFKGDTTIWIIVFLLSIVSMMTVYSATGTLAYKKMGGNTMFYLIRHGSFLLFGIGIIFAVHRVNYKVFAKLSNILLYVSVGLLVFTLLSGVSLNSASRWVSIMGIQFQTSDLAKLSLVLYVAKELGKHQDEIENPSVAFWPIIKWVCIICALIFPANFSTAAMLFLICCVLMYIGRINVKLILKLVGTMVAGFAILLIIAYNVPAIRNMGRVETWMGRIESFTGKGEHSDTEHDFQADHSKMAIVHGGIIGQGPGNSTQRNFLPHPYSDFIYAIIVEETGIIGGTVVLLLYLILLFRVKVIMKNSRGSTATFMCAGLGVSLVIQALINMGVAVNIFPVTGQTLPFISMGGTSVIFTSISVGIILNISRYAENGDLANIQMIENPNNNSEIQKNG